MKHRQKEEAQGNIKPFWNDIALFILRHPRLRHLCRVQHIFDKNSVALGGIRHHNMSYRADELAVLNDGAARQECGQ